MALPSFQTAAGQNAFTTETRTGDYTITQALGAREPTALQITAEFTQTRANYARPAVNTTLTYDNGAGSDVTAYFVDDVDFEQLGAGVQKWTRIWSTIPASWSEPGGTFAMTFPAYVTAAAFGTPGTVTDAYVNGNYINVMTAVASVAAADTVLLDITYLRGGQNYHVTFVTPAAFAGDGTRVPIANNLPGAGAFSSVSGAIVEWSPGRTLPEVIEVDSFLLHDYALASESTVDVLLPQIDKFSPVNSSGYEVDTLSTGTATRPNSATYASMIAAGSLIPGRRSDRAIYAGNIYERTTLMVKAR